MRGILANQKRIIHMRAPVTMPETIARRVSGPVLLSFLKSRIGKLTKYNLKWTFSSKNTCDPIMANDSHYHYPLLLNTHSRVFRIQLNGRFSKRAALFKPALTKSQVDSSLRVQGRKTFGLLHTCKTWESMARPSPEQRLLNDLRCEVYTWSGWLNKTAEAHKTVWTGAEEVCGPNRKNTTTTVASRQSAE